MIKGKKILAIIPARGGSKRLPRKNVLNLNGKPLIAWSIEAAQKSKYIDRVLVSSDDDEIISISEEYLSETIKRPDSLATDTATTVEMIEHVLHNIKDYDYLILLQPTSPLRNNIHIDEAIELLIYNQADAVISVCKMDHSPLWSNKLPADRNMTNFLRKDVIGRRSQDLDDYFRINGAIYVCNIKAFLKEKTLFLKNNIFAYVMNRKFSIDIDEEIDLKMAEFLQLNKDIK